MGSQGSSGSGGSRQLLLCRCDIPDGDQVYIARGLSIGRSSDNTFVIDDPQVSRHHCQVEFDAGGQMVLRCLDPGAELVHNDQHVRELPLVAGLRFHVGPAEFECRAATPSEPTPGRWLARCPFCGSTVLPDPAPQVQACRNCGREVIVFQPRGMGLACIAAKVGPFELVRMAGEGGMGVVFEGLMPEKGQRVAIKLLHPHLGNDRDALRRFEREIEILQKIKHPHVVRVIGFGKWKTHPALITEWLPGGSLAQLLAFRPKGELPQFGQVARWLADACQGLAAIHAVGLVHRDIKPSNLLLTAEARLKIADLGLAKAIGQETTALTVTSLAVGSPRYMAPEQWTNPGGVDRRADIYALGVTFYELLTGRLPVGPGSRPRRSTLRCRRGLMRFSRRCWQSIRNTVFRILPRFSRPLRRLELTPRLLWRPRRLVPLVRNKVPPSRVEFPNCPRESPLRSPRGKIRRAPRVPRRKRLPTGPLFPGAPNDRRRNLSRRGSGAINVFS